MLIWGLAALIGAGLTAVSYPRGEARGALALGVLRWIAATALVGAVLDAPLRRARPAGPVVALDVSASWIVGDDDAAWDAARALADSLAAGDDAAVRLFGEAMRTGPIPERPTDGASRIRPVVEWASAIGRPVQVVTDGRLDDPTWVARLPVGSTVYRLEPPPRPDAVLTALDIPTAAPAGDTVLAQVTVTADAAGAPARQLTLTRDAQVVARRDLEALGPYETRTTELPVLLPAAPGVAWIGARLGDGARRTDSLAVAVQVTGGAPAVVISTAPDPDARMAIATLRAVRRGPVHAYWQVAPGVWRVDGTLAPVDEAVVRREALGASLLVLHGDTSRFGAPERLRAAGLVLMSPPPPGEEYYPVAPPPSPLAEDLSGVPWDSLPPLDVASTRTRPDEGTVVETRRGRRFESRAAIRVATRDAIGQRVVRIPSAGFWRWQARGGRSAEAYDALFGALFDWVGAAPGVATDSLGARGEAARALDAARRMERRPRAPSVAGGPVGTGAVLARPLGARGTWGLLALALVALSAEWILRRRRGLR